MATAAGDERLGRHERFPTVELVRFLADPRRRGDPYPSYARLRARGSVHHTAVAATLVTGHAEAVELLRHPAASSVEAHADLSLGGGVGGAGRLAELPARLAIRATSSAGPIRRRTADAERPGRAFRELTERFLIMMDAPDHTRLRRLTARAFTPRTVERLRPAMAATAEAILDELEPAGGVDLVGAFAYRFPVTVICDLLGVPAADHARFAGWVADLVAGIDVAVITTDRVRLRSDAAARSLDRYLRGLIAERRERAADDLLSALVTASDDGDTLSEDEVVACTALLLVAGHETTANLIANGLWALWTHADQFARWRTDPAGRAAGVVELLRWDSPVQLVQRITTEPITLGGVPVPSGRFVIALVGSANRDPRRFTDPDRLDLGRDEGAPLSFGYGAHHCLGSALALAEAEIALGALFDRFPRLRVALTQPRHRPTIAFRALQELPVRWD